MRLEIDGELVYEFSPEQVKAVEYKVPCCKTWVKDTVGIFDGKVKEGIKQLRKDWVESGALVSAGVTSIPVADADFINLVTSLPGYENRAERIAKEQAR